MSYFSVLLLLVKETNKIILMVEHFSEVNETSNLYAMKYFIDVSFDKIQFLHKTPEIKE